MVGAARHARSDPPLREGSRGDAFGKYQLVANLGRGGMADVFLSVARGQMGVTKVAVIKRLRRELAAETAFRNMFLDEARLAARLSHPNIVHTYEVGEHEGVYFIAMEYLEGQPLNRLLKEILRRKETLEIDLSVRIVADALAGLGHAHDLRDYDGRPLSVIHRDVSPHNIFVTYEGHTKLVDFGIAKAALSSTETEAGILKGKVAYMSPEQATSRRIDQRSDLFAMGIVLWELIARRRLMVGENPANTLHKLLNEPVPPLSTVVGGVDPALEAIVARALEKDAANRWGTAAEMRAALEAWLASRSHLVRPEEVGRRMLSLFAAEREDAQRQVQRHIAAIAASPNDLDPFTSTTGPLLPIGTGVSSGIVANHGAPGPSHHPAFAPGVGPNRTAPSSGPLLIAITIGCLVLAGLLLAIVTMRDRAHVAALVDHEGAAAPGAAEPAAESPTGAPPADSAKPFDPAPPNTGMVAQTTSGSAPARPAHHSASATAKGAAAKAAPLPEDPGFLTVSAYPWAKVTDGSRVICAVTPCNKVSMSAGGHTLTFENGEQPGQKQFVSVQIRPGETATTTASFK